jgi:hypothetical protein
MADSSTWTFNLDPKSAAAALAGGPIPHPANHYDMVPMLRALGGDWQKFANTARPSTNIEDTRTHNILQALAKQSPELRANNSQSQQIVAQNIEDQFFSPQNQNSRRLSVSAIQPNGPRTDTGWPRFDAK